MDGCLLILKMIASQEPAFDYTESFPGNLEKVTCPVCRKIISMAKAAVEEAEKEQEQFKEEVRKDIHELIDICCDKCRLAGRNCLCVICMIKSIKKKYEGAEKCLKNSKKSK